MRLAAREALDQQPVRRRQAGAPLLDAEPVAHLRRQAAPVAGMRQDTAHPVGEMGRQRQPPADIGRHLGRVAGCPHRLDRGLADAFETQHLPGEHEGIAGFQAEREGFLEFAQHPPAFDLHPEHRRFDDGADIHPQPPHHRG
jgi:hypothetical protein